MQWLRLRDCSYSSWVHGCTHLGPTTAAPLNLVARASEKVTDISMITEINLNWVEVPRWDILLFARFCQIEVAVVARDYGGHELSWQN